MIGVSDIAKLAKHPWVATAYKNFLALRDDGYPDMNYIGLNFKGGRVSSLKFYFAFYRKLDRRNIAHFLPHTDDFMRYYQFWDASKVRSAAHTGCAFTVKFDADRTPMRGFHYRLRPVEEAYKLIGEPQTMPYRGGELRTRPGINYEYDVKGDARRRRYYYLESQDQKDYIANRFGKPFASQCRLCELTEFDGGAKVILWTPDYIERYANRPSYFDAAARILVDELREKYGLINLMEGFYENESVVSSYFFNTLGSKRGNVHEGRENFHMDTLRLFLE